MTDCNAIVVFTQASPFTDHLKLDERLFVFDNEKVIISQKWKPDSKGGTEIGFGASVYEAAIVLAYYLERNEYIVIKLYVRRFFNHFLL